MKHTDIINEADLARVIGIGYYELKAILEKIDDEYKLLEINKKNGGIRKIYIPSDRLKYCQKFIADIFKDFTINEHAYGYVKGRSIIDNAKEHVNSKVLHSIDIQNFFESIGVGQIYYFFLSLKFTKKTSYNLTKLTTYKGCLAQGAISSPILSNLIFKNVDNEISNYVRTKGIIYTRYVDDLYFSTQEEKLKIDKIKEIITHNNYKLNIKKERTYKIENFFEITGIRVVKKNNELVLTPRRKYFNKIKSELYYIKKYGLKNHKKKIGNKQNYYKERLLGKILFINTINSEKGNKLLEMYNSIQW